MTRLEKSSRNRMLFGVAGGIAEYFRIDPVIVRVVFILLAFASGIGVLLYLVLALLMPRHEAAVSDPLGVVTDNLRSAPRETSEAAQRVVSVLRGPTETPGASSTETGQPKDEGTTRH